MRKSTGMRITTVFAVLILLGGLGMGCGDDEAPGLDTVDGVLARLPSRQMELARAYCDCPAFLTDLAAELPFEFDRDDCFAELAPPRGRSKATIA